MNVFQSALKGAQAFKLLRTENTNVVWKRTHVVAIPPRKKIGFAEKIVYYVGLTVSTFGFPFWVLYHIKEYQGPSK